MGDKRKEVVKKRWREGGCKNQDRSGGLGADVGGFKSGLSQTM